MKHFGYEIYRLNEGETVWQWKVFFDEKRLLMQLFKDGERSNEAGHRIFYTPGKKKLVDDVRAAVIPVMTLSMGYALEKTGSDVQTAEDFEKLWTAVTTSLIAESEKLAAEGYRHNFDALPYEEISEEYFDIANHFLIPAITDGLTEGLKEYRKQTKSDEALDANVSIDMNTETGVMSLYYGEDDCDGEPFFACTIGDTLISCAAMLEAMEEKGGATSYKHALSNWFEDAVANIPKSAYKGVDIALWVPDVGGDPYLENFE